MTQQREARISSAIMEKLRLNGIFCFKVHGSALMMNGLPDIIACVDGMFIGLETKLPEKRKNVSAVQRLVHNDIMKSGGFVAVVCGASEALAVINGVREGLADARASLTSREI
jgi:hypothetical protein